jgi:phosphoribosyl-ATP pyrophosphohydrolase/phosphoribosyl-AMP cyclohydrolase/histidinol dehydrogenase
MPGYGGMSWKRTDDDRKRRKKTGGDETMSEQTRENGELIPDRGLDEVLRRRLEPVDAQAVAAAAKLVDRVVDDGEDAVRELAEQFDGLDPDAPLVHPRESLERAREQLPTNARELLERTAERIGRFADAQRKCVAPLELDADGARMGHRVVPVDRAGCYAPGGRHPYVSTVLMTVIPARVAGVREIWVASPRPTTETLAAAAIAGADAVLAAGGAHAVAALAHGAGEAVPPCDAVVGPGNRWVTAAKRLVAGLVRIDGLAGPSELIVLADDSARSEVVAADLIAQAEHDPEALPVLVTPSARLAGGVRQELEAQLEALDTASVARTALQRGAVVRVADLDDGVAACERIAPEHLELLVESPAAWASRLSAYGTLFVGEGAAEVLGDYGAGPNHVLPTSGSARAFSGLSVLTFLRFPTTLRVDGGMDRQVVSDCEALARMEGLSGHAASAALRLG